MDEYLAMWNNYTNFNDRTTVRGYWMAILFQIIAFVVLAILSSFVRVLGILLILFYLASIIPMLALGIRRLHDTNRSGFWILICLVPVIGSIVLLIFLCMESVDTENRFGKTV